MAFGQFGRGGNSVSSGTEQSGKVMAAMSDINVTPMVDVMLVLLVIFIITAPLLQHAIPLELPKTNASAVAQKPATITLSFDARGVLYWDAGQGATPLSFDDLGVRLARAAKQTPQPQLQLRADKATRYEVIAQVMAAAQTQGLSKIGFVTESGVEPSIDANPEPKIAAPDKK
ncbi:biopolymer transporter ExbD [soil metagenome]